MSLTLVTGRPNSGKTGILYDAIRRTIDEGGAPALVLPSRADVGPVAREFAERGPKLGVTIASLDDLIAGVWAASGDGRTLVSGAVRSLLLADAITTCHLSCLRESAVGHGLVRLLSPVARGGVERLTNTAAGTGAGAEIVQILAAYRDRLRESSLIELADAARFVETSPDIARLVGLIAANRFSDLTEYQERFLVAASRQTDVWVALPWQKDHPATRALDGLVDRLTAQGAELLGPSPIQYTKSEELRHLEARLFAAQIQPEDTPRRGDVRLSEAYGEEAEALRIAAEIQAALAEGVPAEQIAVVFHNAEEHLATLRSAFAETGIVAEFEAMRAVRDTGLGRALAHLNEFADSSARSALAGFIRSPYSGLRPDVADELEARWRQRAIDRPDRLRAALRQADAHAAELVSAMDSLHTSGGHPETAEKWKKVADSLLGNAYGVCAVRLDVEGLADASAHRALLSFVDSLRLTGLRLRGQDIVRAVLDTDVAVSAESGLTSVRVLSAHRARSQRFRVVIVGGLAAGDFPRVITESPLQTGKIASQLACNGIEVGRLDERDAARLLFYLVASRATERLVLSRQVAASDGSERAPSWLLDEVLDLYRRPDSEHVDEQDLPPVSVLRFDGEGTEGAAPASVRREHRKHAGCSGVADEPSALPSDSAKLPGSNLGMAMRRAVMREPKLLDERVLAGLSERETFSATEIEAYLRCPYGWFHERVVRAESLEPEPDALARGHLCHDVLREVYAQLPEAVGCARVNTQNMAAVLHIAAATIDRAIRQSDGAESLSQRSLAGEMRRRVVGFIRCDAGFLPDYEPASLEWDFGTQTHSFGGFQLKGRIDRIDRNTDGRLLVIDYKTGTVGSNHSAAKFETRGLVQLALYARVVEGAFGGAVVGGLYRGVTWKNAADKQNRGFYLEELAGEPGLVGTDRRSTAEIVELLDAAEKQAALAVSGIREGRIPAEPLDAASCQRCRLAGFCPRSAR